MTPPAPSKGDGRAAAILFIFGSAFVFAVSDVLAKLIVGRLPALEVYFLRSVVVASVTVPVVLARRGVAVFRTRQPGLQLLRGLSAAVASLFFLTALIHLPVADATAINFIWPVLVTLFSVVMLQEKVGIRRALATAAGFIGMLIIVRPGFGAFHWTAVFPLGAAVVWAFASVLTRKMSAKEPAETTIVWSALVALAVGALAMPIVFVTPTWRELGIGLAVGLGSAAGHALVIVAYSRAPASALAPYTYTQLIWAALCGWLAFAALPDGWTVAGASIIAASGIYTAHRERVRRQAASR